MCLLPRSQMNAYNVRSNEASLTVVQLAVMDFPADMQLLCLFTWQAPNIQLASQIQYRVTSPMEAPILHFHTLSHKQQLHSYCDSIIFTGA